MNDSLLDLRGCTVRRGGRAVLRDVTLSVKTSERIAIVGPNGAGKTTLLKCLNRIIPLSLGSVRIRGRLLSEYSQDELARRVAYVPQADGRSVPFTVEEMVLMGRYPHLGPFLGIGKTDREIGKRALEVTGTASLAPRLLDTLSGGERQKVFVAAALAQQTEILLLDEPAAFLDPSHAADIQRTLHRIHRERGMTILCVTHDLNSALGRSDRVVGLKEGAIVFDGSPEEMANPAILDRLFDHEFLLGSHPTTGRPVIFPEES